MPDLLTRARERKLAIYPWTFRGDPQAHRRFIQVHKVDGIFTDTPEEGRH